MTDIETAVNAQAAQLAASLNPNGTLKNGTVSTASIQDRAVTLAKLAFLSNFYAVDTGGADTLIITFAPDPLLVAYAAGLVFWVKAANPNTGACTLNVDGVGAVAIKIADSSGMIDPPANAILAGKVCIFVHNGVNFELCNPETSAVAPSGPKFILVPTLVYNGGAVAYGAAFDASGVIPAGATGVILQCEMKWNTSTDGDSLTNIRPDGASPSYLLCRAGGTDAVATGSQAFMPITAARKFEFEVTETSPGAATSKITIVGYF